MRGDLSPCDLQTGVRAVHNRFSCPDISRTGIRWIVILLGMASLNLPAIASSAAQTDTGSTLTTKEANKLVQYHNKVRVEVGVGPVKWSPIVATFAQQWANEVARTGEVRHRPREGKWKQKYGENIAWGFGGAHDVLSGAERWYAAIKFYTPGTPIPDSFGNFKAGHYTQMVWKDTTEIGAGKAIIQTGERKGWLVIVCNYNPPGNLIDKKPC
ncbi:MAG: CAP family protein [Candidatus Methylomirabilis sp.]|nr:CAP family protein [Candidatus Methylomirabilis sp.]